MQFGINTEESDNASNILPYGCQCATDTCTEWVIFPQFSGPCTEDDHNRNITLELEPVSLELQLAWRLTD